MNNVWATFEQPLNRLWTTSEQRLTRVWTRDWRETEQSLATSREGRVFSRNPKCWSLYSALSGLILCFYPKHRASPCADICRPFGAWKLNACADICRGCPISPSTLQFIRVGGGESFRIHKCESIHFSYWTAPWKLNANARLATRLVFSLGFGYTFSLLINCSGLGTHDSGKDSKLEKQLLSIQEITQIPLYRKNHETTDSSSDFDRNTS